MIPARGYIIDSRVNLLEVLWTVVCQGTQSFPLPAEISAVIYDFWTLCKIWEQQNDVSES